jgi:hypothetical protein
VPHVTAPVPLAVSSVTVKVAAGANEVEDVAARLARSRGQRRPRRGGGIGAPVRGHEAPAGADGQARHDRCARGGRVGAAKPVWLARHGARDRVGRAPAGEDRRAEVGVPLARPGAGVETDLCDDRRVAGVAPVLQMHVQERPVVPQRGGGIPPRAARVVPRAVVARGRRVVVVRPRGRDTSGDRVDAHEPGVEGGAHADHVAHDAVEACQEGAPGTPRRWRAPIPVTSRAGRSSTRSRFSHSP